MSITTVGIDIGSQKTILVADDGEIVRTSTGSVSFPTLIAFHSKAPRCIGDEATSGETIIPLINLLIGKSDQEIQKTNVFSHTKIDVTSSSCNKNIADLVINMGDASENMSTTSLLGFYVFKMWERIKDVYGSEVNISFSIPADSNGVSPSVASAIFDASQIAGIDLSKVSIVETSNALVSAYSRKINAMKGPDRDNLNGKVVILVEVGHVQTTVVLVKIEPVTSEFSNGIAPGISKLSHAHDSNLGSYHFDLKLVEHFSEVCLTKHHTKIESGTKRSARLISGCERIRKLLSQLNDASVTIENLTDNGDVNFSLKRDEFNEISASLLDRIKNVIDSAVETANLDGTPVSFVEILGGGLRMPAIQKLLQDKFGEDIVFGAKLDDASIALGAALVVNRHLYRKLVSGEDANEDAKSYFRVPDDFKDLNGGLSTSEITQAISREQALRLRDEGLRELLAVRNSLESYILEMRSAPKRKFGQLIDSNKLSNILDDSEGWIWDNPDANLEQLRQQDQSLRSRVQELCTEYLKAVEEDRLNIEKKLEEEAKKAEEENRNNGDDETDNDNRKLKKADRMRLVVKNKDEGTELFKDGNYRPAAARYHKALSHATKFFDLTFADEQEVKALKTTLYLNLASCYIKMEKWDQVLSYCNDALSLDSKSHKAFFRRAQYHEAKKDWENALADMKKCQVCLDVEDKTVSQTIVRIQKEIQKEKSKEKKMWSKAFS